MSHIRRLSASHSPYGAVLRFFDSAADQSAGGGSGSLRKLRGCLIAISALMLAAFATQHAMAQSRSSATSGRSAPVAPPSGHQSEAIDLNEGKSAAELFQAGCAVCHQSPAGLGKGRSPNELIGFLRQHYTTSLQHAGALAGFLASAGPGRGAPATATPGAVPNRNAPIDRPPSAIGNRRPPVDDDGDQPPSLLDRRRKPAEAQPRPQEAARPDTGRPQEAVRPDAARPEAGRPQEREAPAKRRPVEKPERPAATARTGSQAPAAAPAAPRGAEPESPANEPAAAPAAPAGAPAAPPAEDKPAAAPNIPL